jgi:UDP-2-acetamido-2,6-beta-L-arabino-hexul-4-ose reductase
VKIAMTGAGGFLGWHTRAFLHTLGEHDVHPFAVGDRFDASLAVESVSSSDRLVLIAGVNRGTDDEVHAGNVLFAEQAAQAVRAAEVPPAVIVFANSTQVGNGSSYGLAKEDAARIIRGAAKDVGARFVDVHLPNLFGEHGRPFYNAVTATFCHLLSRGETPSVDVDRELSLLHALGAVDAHERLGGAEDVLARSTTTTVSELLATLSRFALAYSKGDVPLLASDYERDLFNTYRSFAFEASHAIHLTQNTDARGSFTEVIRSHGGSGQTSFSTTAPGVTRGQHYHRRKMERFTVVAGTADIRLRRLFSDEVVTVPVDGTAPCSVDMPTFWAHSITNTGDETLFTMFWSNEIFDPSAPDTIPETV